jgi:hypothetical protein
MRKVVGTKTKKKFDEDDEGNDFLVQAYEHATEARLNAVSTAELLSRARNGEEAAVEQIRRGHEWLAYKFAFDYADQYKVRQPVELIGALFEGLLVAVGRLVRNSRTDVLKFIEDEPRRSVRDLRRAESSNVLPDSAHNCKRKKKGLLPIERLSRTRDRGNDTDYAPPSQSFAGRLTERPQYDGPSETPDGDPYYVPDRLICQGEAIVEADLLDAIITSDEDQTLVDLLVLNVPKKEIARRMSLTLYAVDKKIDELKKRAGIPDKESSDRADAAHADGEQVELAAVATEVEVAERSLELAISA